MPTTELNRREFLNATLAALVASTLAHNTAAAAARKPNVIIIYTDDHGSVDAGCYGAKDLHTPNIDALASEGVRFTQFYAPSAVCSPSRAGLLTGRYPLTAGVPGNCSSVAGEPCLPASEVTIAEVLKAAGYATGHVGKWHLGFSPETMPNAQGFDYSFGHMGGCIDNYSHFFYWNGPNRHDLWENGVETFRQGEFFGDLMVEKAGEFMEAHAAEPFFLYYAINMPHYPYQGDVDWLRRYREEGVAYPRDLYAAFISTLDARIGQLLAKLDALGLREDTIVILQGDQGHSTEERAHFGGGNAGPYRGCKFSLFEGGIRVPAMIRWPGKIPAGEVRDQVAHGCDWLPTIASLCAAPAPDVKLDGKDISEVIQRADAPTPHTVIHWQIKDGNNAQWAVREGDWKLIGNPLDPTLAAPLGKDDRLFLVNLAEDVSELTNLAKDHPDRVVHLKQLHDAWVDSLT
ncbi:MAG: sulfatase-like hydrolase/transferase [Candidatus Hydrogenedentes bacterium]|nr:sulfatase-like hydrolase/transferase [Candidatus Hydrogenedentota bacterium]